GKSDSKCKRKEFLAKDAKNAKSECLRRDATGDPRDAGATPEAPASKNSAVATRSASAGLRRDKGFGG
ncbi:MAG TPA: hypothetical protein VN048_12345, partial [Verrucomicrobiae bacterium]|nr:hypothetical protein [Verrucomicrobiae bacterium]